MEALTLTGIVTTAWTVLDSLGLNPVSLSQKEVGKQATDYVKNLLATKPTYKNRLAAVIQNLLDEYHVEYGVKATDRQFPFFQSDFLWRTALTYELFEQHAPLTPEDFPALPHLIRPSAQELEAFASRLRAAMKADAELEKRFIEESYKSAAFHFALTGTQQLNELLARPDALSSSIIHSVLDAVEREELAAYKPVTALRQLQTLETVATRFLSADQPLLARLYYLLGRTNQEIAEFDLAESYFIRAHRLQPGHVVYAQEAARAFARLQQPEQAREVLDIIRALHPLNPVAAAVQLALQGREKFDQRYAALPAPIRQNDQFKLTALQLLVNGTAQGSGLADKILRQDLQPYRPSAQLTPENRRWQVTLAVFVVECAAKALPAVVTLGEPLAPLDSAELRAALGILQQYTDLLQPTEKSPFITHHYFMRGVAGWLLTGTATEYAGLRRRFATLADEERLRYAQQLVFTLHQTGENEAALEVLESVDTSKLPELGYLRYEILRRLKRPKAEARAALGRHLAELEPLNEETYMRLLLYLEHCETAADQIAFVDELVRGQQLAPGLPTMLAQAHALVDAAPEQHAEAQALVRAAHELLTPQTPTIYRHEVAAIYHRLKAYEEAGLVLEGWPGYPQVLDKGSDWLRLANQYHRGTDSAGLREDLRAWRLRYGIYAEFCIWEIQLAELLRDWERMLEVVEAATGHVKDASGLRWAKLVALHKLKRRDALLAELESIVHQPSTLHRRHLFLAAALAAQVGHTDWAQHLLYPLASRKEDMMARGKFFQLSLGHHGDTPAPDYALVEVNRSVKYTVDGVEQPRLALTEESVHGGYNAFAEELIGTEKGRKYSMQHQATGRPMTVEILEVTNLYDGLFKEILATAQQKSPDLPFEPLDIGGEDIEHLHAAFSKALGAEGAARQLRNQQLYAEYESHETTFSGLAVGIFHNNALETYHVLTAQEQRDVPGFIVPPRSLFAGIAIDPTALFILDWTSLPLLHRLSKEFALVLPQKLGISLHVVEFLEQKLQELQRSKPVELTVEVIGDRVVPHFYPPELHERHISYLQELLAWIEAHCTTRIVTEKLDTLRQAKLREGDHEVHMQYLVDTAFLAAPPATLLVSDDTTFLQMSLRPGNVVSTEVFLSALFPAEYEKEWLAKLLDWHYVGLSFDGATLLRVFKEAGGQFSGRALQCLKSLPRQLLTEPGSMQEVIGFVREVYLMATLLPDQKSRTTVAVLTACLTHLTLNTKLKALLTQLITLKFVLLQDRLRDVLNDFEQAWQVAHAVRAK